MSDEDQKAAARNCMSAARGAFLLLAIAWGWALGERSALLDEQRRLLERREALGDARERLRTRLERVDYACVGSLAGVAFTWSASVPAVNVPAECAHVNRWGESCAVQGCDLATCSIATETCSDCGKRLR